MGALETLFANLELDRLAAIILAQAYSEGGFHLMAQAPRAMVMRARRYYLAMLAERQAIERDPQGRKN